MSTDYSTPQSCDLSRAQERPVVMDGGGYNWAVSNEDGTFDLFSRYDSPGGISGSTTQRVATVYREDYVAPLAVSAEAWVGCDLFMRALAKYDLGDVRVKAGILGNVTTRFLTVQALTALGIPCKPADRERAFDPFVELAENLFSMECPESLAEAARAVLEGGKEGMERLRAAMERYDELDDSLDGRKRRRARAKANAEVTS